MMGLDYGDKTIGVAVSDELVGRHKGLKSYIVVSLSEDIARLKAIVREYDVTRNCSRLAEEYE